jgi:ubiquinone/menaquinone biosynthesis C-methylase UbiE
VRGAVPLAIEQIDTMLQLIKAARGEHFERFLDLGCGDGVLASTIFEDYPHTLGFLADSPQSVLDTARRRLQGHTSHTEFIVTDHSKPGWMSEVAHGVPFDAVVSAFSIHPLPDWRKRELYAEIFRLLKPDGLFLNIEHVSSATRWTQSVWDDYMIDAIFGKQIAAGKSRADVAREYYSHSSQEVNVLAPLEVQCDWLREIGYENVDVYLKVQELALFGGQRPATAE